MRILTAGRFLLAAGLLALQNLLCVFAADTSGLELESKIPLGDVRGRIDHLAIDLSRRRLYVAELGNDSVGVIDLATGQVIRRLSGLPEPQGIAYMQSTDTVYVANAGDGSVRLFHGSDLAPAGLIALGGDADNVRVDDGAQRLFVGYGDGALAVIDASVRTKMADISLKAHPESFQLDRSGRRIFVNVPEAREIALVDRSTNMQVASWRTEDLRANFPLAIDETRQLVLVAFRRPHRLGVFNESDGLLLSMLDTCGDADDVALDAERGRAYVICGEGYVDVFAANGSGYSRSGRLSTSEGARTALFVPELDRLFVAVRATRAQAPGVWVLRPLP